MAQPAYDAFVRNAIDLQIRRETAYRLGGTRFGGRPDVPADFVWPRFETQTYFDDTVKPRPLSFLAQFNCAELCPLDRDDLLPHTGLLSFFYELGSQRWGYDPKDAGCARVFWFADTSSLSPAEFPQDLEEDFRLPMLHISALAKPLWPDWEDYSLIRRVPYSDWKPMAQEAGWEESGICSRLLGWPSIIQNNMTRECELVSRGHYLGDGWKEVPEADKMAAARTSLMDWRLLFQLDTVDSDDFELTFGDCGRIYFYIRTEDLILRRFDRVWLIQQCC